MKSKIVYYFSAFLIGVLLFIPLISFSNGYFIISSPNSGFKDTTILKDPLSVKYLKKHLRKGSPKLILTPTIIKDLKKELKTDQILQNMYTAIKNNAQQIMKEPLLKHKKIGKRLLAVSREMLYRMNVLCIVYAINKDPQILDRINKEVIDVCNFKDWNPSHFLDVAEMSMAVSIAVDWTGGHLPRSTIELAKSSLIEKAIKPSYGANMWWIDADNNWNQVCNGGIIAASLTIADIDPALAAKTISRSLRGMPNGLKEYAPDGIYPEGPTYWQYGTTFSELTSSMLESALGIDFGLSQYQPFMESPNFYLQSIAPSGDYYNFSDCGLERSTNGDITLTWFAQKTGNEIYFPAQQLSAYSQNIEKLSRFIGAGFIWASQFEAEKKISGHQLPLNWKGEGPEPLVFFRGDKTDPRHYYFAAKGGEANHNHGNMDAGSFIFELDGVRWVIDPGTQDYYDVEKTGFDLWGMCQKCDRWKLLTKNNYGHSTLTVNNQMFNVAGFVNILNYKDNQEPEVTFNMSPLYNDNLKNATRSFVKKNNHSLLITDKFETTDSTKLITWQLITTAQVKPTSKGTILTKDSKQLRLDILSPANVQVSVISLDPPPLKIDKKIENLKRIEIRIPAWFFSNHKGLIKVQLEGEK